MFAEKNNLIEPSGICVEGTFGNTGIGLTLVNNAKGYKTVIVMPNITAPSKRDILQNMGAELHLVDPKPFSDPGNYQRVSKKLAKEIEAKRIKADTNLKKAKKEAKGPTPQEDMLRFGQEQKKFRDLAYKERVLSVTDKKGTDDESDDETTVSMQYVPRPGGELFQKQVEAYGDSLKLAGLAQKYGTQTPDIRKIDRNRNAITKERNELYKKLMSQEFPLVPGPDGTFTRISDQEKDKASMEQANNMLVQKYGKAIIPLLSDLRNR